jgi:hypothetical protein
LTFSSHNEAALLHWDFPGQTKRKQQLEGRKQQLERQDECIKSESQKSNGRRGDSPKLLNVAA